MESKDASLPKISSNNQANTAGRLHLVASPSQLATTARVANQRNRLCHLLTLYRTKWPSQAEQPAAVRCKPSRPTMPVPLVPSSDAVPHRTDSHQAMSAAVVRCTQPTNNHVPTPGRHQDHDCRCAGSATPFELATWRNYRHRLKPPWTMGRQRHKPSWVSRDDASKEGTTPKAPPSLVQDMDRVFTQRTLCGRVRAPK